MENDTAKINLSAIAPAVNVIEKLNINGLNIENKDLLERAVGFIENTAKSLIVTEETLMGGKNSRKELNKAATVIDDKRKEVKKSFEEPLKSLEKEMNGYRDRIKDSVSYIDVQIKQFEEKERNDRLIQIKDLINEMAPNYGVEPGDIEIDARWLNKSTSKKQRVDGIAASMTTVAKEQKLFKETTDSVIKYCEKVGIQPEGFTYLVGSFDLLTIMNRIDEAVEIQKNKIEVERQAELARIEAQKQTLANVGEKLVNSEIGQVNHIEHRIEFTIQGLPEQITELAKFIKKSGLKVQRAGERQELIVED